MSWDEIFERFAEETGLSEFSLDAEGNAAVVFDNDLKVNFLAQDGGLWLVARVGPIPDFIRDDIHRAMLASNYPGPPGGLCLALDGNGEAMLSKYFDAAVEYPLFVSALENFLERLADWKGRVANA